MTKQGSGTIACSHCDGSLPVRFTVANGISNRNLPERHAHHVHAPVRSCRDNGVVKGYDRGDHKPEPAKNCHASLSAQTRYLRGLTRADYRASFRQLMALAV